MRTLHLARFARIFWLQAAITPFLLVLPACLLDVVGYDAKQSALCGDDSKGPSEPCDGSDIGGQTCTSLGYSSGELRCSTQCTLDTSQCVGIPQPSCGDGKLGSSEECDGLDLAGQDCVSKGHDGGNLTCSQGCAFDESFCFEKPSEVLLLDVSATGAGAEILTDGVFVVANHFGGVGDGMPAQAPVTLANGLVFGINAMHMAAGWTPLHSTSTDAHLKVQGVQELNFKELMASYFWVAYANSVSTMNFFGLTQGNIYRLQLISPNPEKCEVTLDKGSPVIWDAKTPSVLRLTWIATGATATVVFRRTEDEINFNGYALHDMTPAAK